MSGFKRYLHQFEFERHHPCCLARLVNGKRKPIDTSDIVFVVTTSSQTQAKALGVLNSWGKGLEHLLLISDKTDATLGSIEPGSGEAGGGTSEKIDTNPAHRQIWALKHLFADPLPGSKNALDYKSKPWFFLTDDDTWVNVPALLEVAARYDPLCPVTFGYVWSNTGWTHDRNEEPLDYVSSSAGLLVSQRAFLKLAPALGMASCPYMPYADITFGRCSWTSKVQIVHHRGFYFDPPDRSPDRHAMVWLPPVAEAVTYHYVLPHEMETMTTYANSRWLWTPPRDKTGNATIAFTPHAIRRLHAPRTATATVPVPAQPAPTS